MFAKYFEKLSSQSALEQVKNGDHTETVHFSCLVLIGNVLEILLKYFFRGILTGTTGDLCYTILNFFVIIQSALLG